MKKTLALGAGLATLWMASGALATGSYQVGSVALFGGSDAQDATVTLSGTIAGYGSYSQSVLAGVYALNGGQTIAFCDDLFDALATEQGFSAYPSPAYTYTPGALSTAEPVPGSGVTLTTAQAEEISGLVSEGAEFAVNAPDNWELAVVAIQAAIWHAEYGVDATFAPTATGAIEASDYTTYIGQTFTAAPTAISLADGTDGSGNAIQGLVAVPEPAAWALMLVGFGALGASLRARRARLFA
jgi:hypothetical protein